MKEKLKGILYGVGLFFFFLENHAVYATMRKIANTARQATDDKMFQAHFILDT